MSRTMKKTSKAKTAAPGNQPSTCHRETAGDVLLPFLSAPIELVVDDDTGIPLRPLPCDENGNVFLPLLGDEEEALAKSNYETLIMAGNRLPYLHAPDIAEELALAEAAILAVTGRPAPETGPSCQDLGAFAEMEEVFAALDDQAAEEPEGSR